ncbi:hypothetical protein CLV63_14017 [Murinocardiopsis flavida]|uniref:Xaa-Pro dipeptidyl-peptidase C-terminal domain-containing protein n=1 Tax=Murinocardiopsis flavida TaxID=645275 RepID=A0A2P8CF17_9ACTN|nr:CocE/NonD family hydrolase [Murinocardiopsis flavida]PSK83565.1 hypothetical protein CLV63_14017 [Murinocardiopsis flavida]
MPHVMSHLLERLWDLPAPETRDLRTERGLRIPLPDGGELRADLCYPRRRPAALPTMLLRSPYGRKGPLNEMSARVFAERGFEVLTVSSRGTFGSTGEFRPMHDDRTDGAAVLTWLREQRWFNGVLALGGASYLGYTQWALAVDNPPEVKAMAPHVTSSRLALTFVEPGATQLDTLLRWSASVATQEEPWTLTRVAALVTEDERRLQRAMGTLPLKRADRVRLRRDWPFYQELLHHDSRDPYWKESDYSGAVAAVRVPAAFVAGWYDLFLADQLRDFAAMRESGTPARLTVGPWTHGSPGNLAAGLRETLEWAAAHCAERPPPDRAPVRLYVMGAEQWRDFDHWPPPDSTPAPWFLHPGGGLRPEPPEPADDAAGPTRYRYDPASPTPNVGGPLLHTGKAGRKDNRGLEARPDVRTFTSAPLAAAVEVIGEVHADVWFRSSLDHTDVFVRLCDVDERGRSYNICDGVVAIAPQTTDRMADGTAGVRVRLTPTAHRFRRGHRIRVQVSSGAHPYFARNPGTGADRADATVLRPADQEVFHDTGHPSAVVLPVQPTA